MNNTYNLYTHSECNELLFMASCWYDVDNVNIENFESRIDYCDFKYLLGGVNG